MQSMLFSFLLIATYITALCCFNFQTLISQYRSTIKTIANNNHHKLFYAHNNNNIESTPNSIFQPSKSTLHHFKKLDLNYLIKVDVGQKEVEEAVECDANDDDDSNGPYSYNILLESR